MTIEVKISCDASGCFNERDLYDWPTDSDIEDMGWHLHPGVPEQQYCDECWPVVKKEIDEIRNSG